ncbi:nuclear protein es2 domain-containing protein [Ditylenchus destructor]|nr:nuclear protein es2 domain-containing protein [Ditylenchus destructor]
MANSFDRVDSLIPVPESSRKEKAVCLGAKQLETKKENRKVLAEEKYVDNLEKLIVRDYFPELPKLKAQAEYLEAVARNDHVKIRELQIRYSTRRTERRTSPTFQQPTPSDFDAETPGPSTIPESPYANQEGDNETLIKKKKREAPLDKLTVQSYLDRYTSEDNASFEELAQIHNKRERAKNAWMYEAEQRHNESLVFRAPEPIAAADEQLLAIRNGKAEKPLSIDNWSYKARNNVFFKLEEASLTMAEYIDRVKQNEKVINKEATRFKAEHIQQPHQNVMARAAFQQAANNSGHVDITGKEKGLGSSTLGLVATPTPMPGVDESPLMTWGEIEGTPFRLDAPDIPETFEDGPTFKMPDIPVREKVAQEISEQIAKRYHGKRKHAMAEIQKMAPKTPSFNSSRSSGKLTAMSPAARRFATDKLGIRVGTDKVKREVLTPKTPGSTRSGAIYSPAVYKMVKVKKESASPATRASHGSAGSTSVTDNLLNLPPSSPPPSSSTENSAPNRPTASDFF